MMIIFLNGWPGVGKLTVARELVRLMSGRLLDAHTIYNVGFYLTEFKSPAFYDTVRKVRDVAFERVLELGPDVPVIMTNAFASDSEWAKENWLAVNALAERRGSKLFVVLLTCSPEENKRRIQMPEREILGKLRDPEILEKSLLKRTLLEPDTSAVLRLETTSISPEQCASQIADWIEAAKLGSQR